MLTLEQIKEKYLSAWPDLKTEIFGGRGLAFSVSTNQLPAICKALYRDHQLPLKTMLATDDRPDKRGFNIHYVFGIPRENAFLVVRLPLGDGTQFPSLV